MPHSLPCMRVCARPATALPPVRWWQPTLTGTPTTATFWCCFLLLRVNKPISYSRRGCLLQHGFARSCVAALPTDMVAAAHPLCSAAAIHEGKERSAEMGEVSASAGSGRTLPQKHVNRARQSLAPDMHSPTTHRHFLSLVARLPCMVWIILVAPPATPHCLLAITSPLTLPSLRGGERGVGETPRRLATATAAGSGITCCGGGGGSQLREWSCRICEHWCRGRITCCCSTRHSLARWLHRSVITHLCHYCDCCYHSATIPDSLPTHSLTHLHTSRVDTAALHQLSV